MSLKTELLAPAGSVESMKAAFCAGADAVYIGGQLFGARAYADNPDSENLLKAIRYAHLHGKKLYLTVNTLLKETELEERLADWLKPYYLEGLDAVIVQDLGVLRLIRERFPDLHIHASTQMTAAGALCAGQLASAGVSRLILPRELSLAEISAIHRESGIELEAFVHGALCYCYSGQCLFSSLAGGRSGNRGRCAQPCRMPYSLYDGKKRLAGEREGYLLSPKDLNALELLPQILEAGVYSLKIEGRMKRPEYTAGVVSIYRSYLDRLLAHPEAPYRVSEADQKTLYALFHRKDFTQGYYLQHNGKEMITVTAPDPRPEAEEICRLFRERYLGKIQKEKGKGIVRIESGKPAIIEMSACGRSVTVTGDMVSEAKTKPLTEADIRKSMEKTGDAVFEWETLSVITDGQAFCPVSRLNELRRSAFEAMEAAICDAYRRTERDVKTENENVCEAGEHPSGVCTEPSENGKCFDAVRSESSDNGKSFDAVRRELSENGKSFDSVMQPSDIGEYSDTAPFWSVVCETRVQLEYCRNRPWISLIYLDYGIGEGRELEDCVSGVLQAGKECGLVLPRMVRRPETEWIRSQYASWRAAGITRFLASTPEALLVLRELKSAERCGKNPEIPGIRLNGNGEELREAGLHETKQGNPETGQFEIKQRNPEAEPCGTDLKPREADQHEKSPKSCQKEQKTGCREAAIVADHTLYTWNRKACLEWKAWGADMTTAPAELNANELAYRGLDDTEMIVYGYLPMMISANCLVRTVSGCSGQPRRLTLRDRLGNQFPVRNFCGPCYNIIYNHLPLCLSDQYKKLSSMGAAGFRIQFSLESGSRTEEILDLFETAMGNPGLKPQPDRFTRGHFNRGVL